MTIANPATVDRRERCKLWLTPSGFREDNPLIVYATCANGADVQREAERFRRYGFYLWRSRPVDSRPFSDE